MSRGIKPKHIGRNISRIRELRGMKQEVLAEQIGISQQTVSNIEGSEEIEKDKVAEFAKALGVTPEALENFTEESVLNYFNSQYNDGNIFGTHCFCPFNPIEKLLDTFDDIKKLYERLIQAEKVKTEYLERVLKNK
ncbi:helix-turn-helix domain-containing protein [Flavobacterium hercynium]|uniref:Transcriptional regulator n=1 Tax=Flavobacterium hercynium TaxID=387094 RepID=A0A226GQC8_9FLAO|nr:helix-turn-helix transcriptional regulator [Flavobacterium hercynium]OXA83894.1 transcriptional regulator [Flavobacterium hercynium]SMP37333.1 Transcriptional regulator, contains XRE-family HTH domain [Flavobacterium hercynium]